MPPATASPDLAALFADSGAGPAPRAARPGAAPGLACRVGLVGEHPAGFDTCGFDEAELTSRFGVDVERIDLETLFAAARAADGARIGALKSQAAERLEGIETLDGEQVERSLRCYSALRDMAEERQLDGFAVRCWPETFTEYGCAVCGAMATLNGERIPASCEADMLGTVGSRLLQSLADGPAMLTDIVDFDAEDDTAVLWHCGLAPLDFCDPDFAPRATIHTNRRMPLLHEFPPEARARHRGAHQPGAVGTEDGGGARGDPAPADVLHRYFGGHPLRLRGGGGAPRSHRCSVGAPRLHHLWRRKVRGRGRRRGSRPPASGP